VDRPVHQERRRSRILADFVDERLAEFGEIRADAARSREFSAGALIEMRLDSTS
jgi:hypothetical protein